jgi:hypothetical protein
MKPVTSRSSQASRMATGAVESVRPASHSRDVELLLTTPPFVSILVEYVARVDHPLCDLTAVLLNDVCIPFPAVGVQPPDVCVMNPIAIGGSTLV